MPKNQFDFQERTPDVPRTPGKAVDYEQPTIDMEKPMFPKEFEYPSPQGEPECHGGKK